MPPLDPQAASALRDKLLEYRKRLLDLSLRNKLLNWKPSKRFTIYLHKIGLVEAYKTLVEKENSIELIPKYDQETYEAAEADIPDRAGFLTGLAEEELANKCLRSRREAEALQRDSGINYLHLCLGFIEWTEASTSEKVLKAPLVLVPATLVKRGINEVTGIAEYEVKFDQTEVILNPSLVEKLRSEFGVELPSFAGVENAPPDVEALKDFVARIADIAKMRAHWKFCDDIRLTFVSFAKLRMYRDLDPAQWDKDPLEDNILIQSLFGLASANEPGLGADNGQTMEENPKADGLPLVVLADSSQHQAVADAVHGANMVIEGPPGTGKSQTLTNIIACLISSGKSVLFVAEKFAALDIVRGNLESVGLDAFCFGMHGARASKSAVYSDLKKRLEANFPPPRRLDSVRAEWQSTRQTLNDYVVAASQRIGPREETYTEICGKVEVLRSKKLSPPLSLIGDGKLIQFQERETFLSDAQGVMSDRRIPRQHGWLGLDAQNLAAGHEDHLLQPLPRVLQLLTFLAECEHFIGTTLATKVHLKLEDCIGLTSVRLAPFALSESIIWDAKQALSIPTNRAVVERCQSEALAIEKAVGEASTILPRDKRSLLRTDLQEGLSRMSDRAFYTFAIRDISIESFRILGENLVRLEEMFAEAESLQLAAQTTLGGGLILRDQLATFRALTPGIQDDLAKEHLQNGLHSIVDRCKQQGTALLERRNALSETFSLVGDLPPAVELRQVREDIKMHGLNGFARIFSGKYRQARKSAYRWLTLPKAYKYPGIISDLKIWKHWAKTRRLTPPKHPTKSSAFFSAAPAPSGQGLNPALHGDIAPEAAA